jgi:hypothetical protein
MKLLCTPSDVTLGNPADGTLATEAARNGNAARAEYVAPKAPPWIPQKVDRAFRGKSAGHTGGCGAGTGQVEPIIERVIDHVDAGRKWCSRCTERDARPV